MLARLLPGSLHAVAARGLLCPLHPGSRVAGHLVGVRGGGLVWARHPGVAQLQR
jgi:hypothetical protein